MSEYVDKYIAVCVNEDGSYDLRSSPSLTADELAGYLVGAAIDMLIHTSKSKSDAAIYLASMTKKGMQRINAAEF